MSNNQTHRVDAERFLVVAQVLVGLGLLLIPMLLIESIGLVEFLCKRKSESSTKNDRNVTELRVFMYLQILTSATVVGIMAVPVFVQPFPAALDCTGIALTVCLLYCISTQMTYLFFITKAALVKEFEKSVWFNFIYKATKYGLYIFIPCFVVPVAVVITRGIVTPEGVCVLHLSQLWFPTLFIFGNIGLCGSLLFLFVSPLRMHAKKTAAVNQAVSKQMVNVANKNIRLASIMALVSSLSVIGTCIVTALAIQDRATYDFVLIYSYASTSIDLIVSCGCARLMTSLWKPVCMKNLFGASSTDTSIESGQINGNAIAPVDGGNHRSEKRPLTSSIGQPHHSQKKLVAATTESDRNTKPVEDASPTRESSLVSAQVTMEASDSRDLA